MANQNAPRGFVPVSTSLGASTNFRTSMYCIPANDTNQYGPGDAVKSLAGGDANGVPEVVKALGTDTVRGVITGVVVGIYNNISLADTNIDLTVQNIPASKLRAYYVMVADDPNQLFELQDDGGSALTGTACNKNASFTVVNPTTPQQMSASVLATASVATTQALNLRIMGLVQRANNAFGIYAKWLVRFNQHELQGNTAGI